MTEIRMGSVIANRYRLDSLIGEGGMATVWRGTDLSLSREIAVKVLREKVATSAEAVARFRREAHSAAKLNHSNVVQIYDTGVDGAVYYIVMEYLPEPDLKRIIKEWAPLPEQKVLDVAVQCCKALAYAHRNGIIHRDIKPHNILFTDDGRAKLSDFGIAAAVGTPGTTPSGHVIGSAQYMAPEQIQGSPAGPHSDVYSLGCVLYEALTGHLPFHGATQQDVARSHLEDRPVPLRQLNPNITPALEFVINKAMAREVAQRYRTSDEMLADLMKVEEGRTLDRTGVFSPPEGATRVMRPLKSEPEMDIEPGMPPRAAERPQQSTSQGAPVIRPPVKQERSPWTMVAITAIGLITLILIVWIVKSAFAPQDGDKQVQVPMVKGMTLDAARLSLEQNDLDVGKIEFKEDAVKPEGQIIDQSPVEGETIAVGTKVNLVINRGTQLVTTPNTEGMTMTEADARFNSAGVTTGSVSQIYHATIPAEYVISQSVRAGTKVEKGSTIDIQVSKGPDPQTAQPEEPDQGKTEEPTPEVTLSQDESYTPANPAQRRYIVTVTVQGQRSGQNIQIIKQDDRSGRVSVLSASLNPNQSKQIPVVIEGAASIEVLHEGNTVFQEEIQAPEVTPEGF